MRHAWILAGIGLAAGLAGVVVYFTVGGAQLGPAWYPVSIAIEAIPVYGSVAGWLQASAVADELAPSMHASTAFPQSRKSHSMQKITPGMGG